MNNDIRVVIVRNGKVVLDSANMGPRQVAYNKGQEQRDLPEPTLTNNMRDIERTLNWMARVSVSAIEKFDCGMKGSRISKWLESFVKEDDDVRALCYNLIRAGYQGEMYVYNRPVFVNDLIVTDPTDGEEMNLKFATNAQLMWFLGGFAYHMVHKERPCGGIADILKSIFDN